MVECIAQSWLDLKPARTHDGRGALDRHGRDEAARRHAAKVARVVDQLRAYGGPGPVSLRKRAVAHQVPKRGDLKYSDAKIDVSALLTVLGAR